MANLGRTIEMVNSHIEKLRAQFGPSICDDPVVDDGIIEYNFMPDDITGYKVQIDVARNTVRHCGNARGCFWTEWTKLY